MAARGPVANAEIGELKMTGLFTGWQPGNGFATLNGSEAFSSANDSRRQHFISASFGAAASRSARFAESPAWAARTGAPRQ
jgi:hypothetical protein